MESSSTDIPPEKLLASVHLPTEVNMRTPIINTCIKTVLLYFEEISLWGSVVHAISPRGGPSLMFEKILLKVRPHENSKEPSWKDYFEQGSLELFASPSFESEFCKTAGERK